MPGITNVVLNVLKLGNTNRIDGSFFLGKNFKFVDQEFTFGQHGRCEIEIFPAKINDKYDFLYLILEIIIFYCKQFIVIKLIDRYWTNYAYLFL